MHPCTIYRRSKWSKTGHIWELNQKHGVFRGNTMFCWSWCQDIVFSEKIDKFRESRLPRYTSLEPSATDGTKPDLNLGFHQGLALIWFSSKFHQLFTAFTVVPVVICQARFGGRSDFSCWCGVAYGIGWATGRCPFHGTRKREEGMMDDWYQCRTATRCFYRIYHWYTYSNTVAIPTFEYYWIKVRSVRQVTHAMG